MKKLFILLIFSFFSLQSYAESCSDGSDPVKSISADGTYFEYFCGPQIERYDGDFEIPEDANPNYQTLLYFLDGYLNKWDELYKKWPNDEHKYKIEKSKNPYVFNFELKENADVKNQMQKTALLSYMLYENGKIVVDEITPKERFGELFNNQSKLHSQSVGKSITSYILGHAICGGYISSIDAKIDDWPAVKNTLYENQKIIDLLNMNAADQNYVVQNGLINSNRWYNNYSVEDILKNELQGSKKSSSSRYNYHGFMSNLLGTYVVYKSGDDFQKILNKVFQEKAQIENSVFFTKQPNANVTDITFWNQFRANRYDYLRISRAMINDWQQDTCVGKYLKNVYDTAIPKNKRYSSGFRLGFTKKYAGQFHTHFRGINRPIMSMDGFGGQVFILDFEKDRIIAIQAIHDNFNFDRLVSKVLNESPQNLNSDSLYEEENEIKSDDNKIFSSIKSSSNFDGSYGFTNMITPMTWLGSGVIKISNGILTISRGSGTLRANYNNFEGRIDENGDIVAILYFHPFCTGNCEDKLVVFKGNINQKKLIATYNEKQIYLYLTSKK